MIKMAAIATFCVVLTMVCLSSTIIAQESCYADSKDPYLDFATITAYQHRYNKQGIPPLQGCKPVQLWMLCRHGTRYPDLMHFPPMENVTQIRDQVIANYNANKSSLCVKDIDSLRDWQFNVSRDEADMLTAQGGQDLYQLGLRFKGYFPELFNDSYSPNRFVFRHSNTVRTKESAEYFTKGLFGTDFNTSLPYSSSDDDLLRDYTYCPAWSAQISGTEFWQNQKFGQSEFMRGVLSNVSHRLGFDYSLSSDDINGIYNMCRYQKAWNVSQTSPWCAAFSTDDLKVLEYSEDMLFYYISGSMSKPNMDSACPIVKDMFDHFSAVETQPGVDHPAAVVYFVHEIMVDLVATRLGLIQNFLPLTADNYPDQQARLFRTSRWVPFAGNFLAVLYNCSGELTTMFYQAEYTVPYPGCTEGQCNWSYVKDKLQPIVQDSACTVDRYCSRTATLTHASITGLVLLIVASGVITAQ